MIRRRSKRYDITPETRLEPITAAKSASSSVPSNTAIAVDPIGVGIERTVVGSVVDAVAVEVGERGRLVAGVADAVAVEVGLAVRVVSMAGLITDTSVRPAREQSPPLTCRRRLHITTN